MLLIVGLGNPGRIYENTRHNVGFMLVDRLCAAWKIKLSRAAKAFWGKGTVAGKEAVLIKPQTFMNLSGDAVSEFKEAFSVPVESVIAAFDDADLPFGRIRLRKSGGSGGHKGINSLIEHLGSAEFPRVRLGIGRPQEGSIVDYVLSPFSQQEADNLDDMLGRGAASVEMMIAEGMDAAMNRFNASN